MALATRRPAPVVGPPAAATAVLEVAVIVGYYFFSRVWQVDVLAILASMGG